VQETDVEVPNQFAALVESVSGNWPGFFGSVIPLLETRLGIALIFGALSLPAALLSLLAPITYWSSD
jgi:hypothetical protein